ncbi:polypeptide deformylase domain-containing protein [Ditylenchus destructor]|nr:polypeptide deformylase domain-containing protein [Ditylenchus destructor]
MLETMYDAEGIGLAATQIDVHERVLVMDVSEERNQPLVLVNPELVAASEDLIEGEEGCLSVPTIYDKVMRHKTVTVQALDRDGKTFQFDAEGLLAVCIQHELDHLLGKVFVERPATRPSAEDERRPARRVRGNAGVRGGRAAGAARRALRGAAGAQPAGPARRARHEAAGLAGEAAGGEARHCGRAQPRSLRLDGKYPDEAEVGRQALLDARPDVLIVAAYGLILPQWVLDLPRLGCLNIHASLLPRWRGAAPIQRAIEAGDARTGVTIMQMDAGLDTGDMLLIERLPIAPADTTATLHDKLAALGGRMIVEALELAACGGFRPEKQPEAGVTYAHKIEKAESQIRWSDDAARIARRLRAFDPFPGGVAQLDGEPLKVWRAEVVEIDGMLGEPGRVMSVSADGPVVACGTAVAGGRAARLSRIVQRLDAAAREARRIALP